MASSVKEKLVEYMAPEFQDVDGDINYRKLAHGLTIRIKDLSVAVHKTTRSLEKNYKSRNIQRDLRKISYIWILLRDMLGPGSDILMWLKSPNPDFDGLSPLDMICKGKSEAVIDYLSNIKTGQLA